MAAKNEQQAKDVNQDREVTPFWLDSSPLEDSVYKQDDNGDTGLHIIILWGKQMENKVITTIASTTDVSQLNILNNDNYSLLHMAVAASNPRIIEILVSKGAYLWFQNNEGNTALHLACGNNDSECARLLLRGALPDEIKDWAVGLELMPSRVRELDMYNKQGQTCLHVAAFNNNKELVRILILYGATVGTETLTHGYTALQIAIEQKFFKLADFLSQKCIRSKSMANLIEVQDSEETFQNLSYNIERLYEQNRSGYTQLHYAICKGIPYEQIAIKIINSTSLESLLDLVNVYQHSALHMAVTVGSWRICKVLIKKRANPCLKDSDGNTALHLACMNDDIMCAEALLYRDSEHMVANETASTLPKLEELRLHNGEGKTCLHVAVVHSNMALANLVLLHGADIDAINYFSGRTALHIATSLGQHDMVEFLLKKWKANVNAGTSVGKTAYEIAMKNNDRTMADLLLKFGAHEWPIINSDGDESRDDHPGGDENNTPL